MLILKIKISHCNDHNLDEVLTFEDDDVSIIKIDLKTNLENSFNNAVHLMKKNLYPSSEIDINVELISSNFLNTPEAIKNFNAYNKTFINELSTHTKAQRNFFNSTFELDEDDVLPGFNNYIEREKAFNRIKSGISYWDKHQDFFSKLNKKKENHKSPSSKP